MNYYIDYKKRYPYLDRIIHGIRYGFFVLFTSLSCYMVQRLFMFYIYTADDGVVQYSEHQLLILTTLLVALVSHILISKWRARSTASRIFPTMGRL